MRPHDYTFAVARVRGRESSLLTRADLEQLLGAADLAAALRMLADRGWGEGLAEGFGPAELLACELKRTWDFAAELAGDPAELAVFRIPGDYHNLKAALKLAFTRSAIDPGRVFVAGGSVDAGLILRAAVERDYALLPEEMARAAREASEALLHTGDGQLCDIACDRASLEAVWHAGRASTCDAVGEYARLFVATGDIRVASRCARARKPLGFVRRALADTPAIDAGALAAAAAAGEQRLVDLLSQGTWHEAAEALRDGPVAFERWCDDLLLRSLKPQKMDSFSLGPVAAYVAARQAELKCVRMVLAGKASGLSDDIVRQRLRETYV